jgi:hypothetical protein
MTQKATQLAKGASMLPLWQQLPLHAIKGEAFVGPSRWEHSIPHEVPSFQSVKIDFTVAGLSVPFVFRGRDTSQTLTPWFQAPGPHSRLTFSPGAEYLSASCDRPKGRTCVKAHDGGPHWYPFTSFVNVTCSGRAWSLTQSVPQPRPTGLLLR